MIQKLLKYSPQRMRKLRDDAIPLSIYGTDYYDIPFIRPVNPSTPVNKIDPPKIVTPARIFNVETNNEHQNVSKTLDFVNVELGVQPLVDDSDNDLIQKLMESVDLYKNKNFQLKEENNKLKNNILALYKENESLKNIVSKIEYNFELRFNSLLSNIFTPTQIDMLLNPKLKAYKWTPDDISSAITLRSVSPKAYRYLKNKKCFPLPGMSTLRTWASTFTIQPGILTNVLKLMKAKDDSFLNIQECLTGEVIESTDLITNSSHKFKEMDNDLAQIESTFGTSNVQISNTCMDLLDQFESEALCMDDNNSFNGLKKEVC
ncbi:hypothetical protein ACI65C_011130 [Semiaphis heraclei]